MIIREDLLVDPLDRWLAGAFAPHRREHTIATLIAQAATNDPPRAGSIARNEVAIDYEGRLARYQAALDAGADPTVVASWIAQAQADRDAALRRTYRQQPAQTTTPVTADELNAILDQLGNLVDALRIAHPDHKHEVYRSLGLQLTYQPETQTVQARIDLGPHRWVFARVGGGT